MANFKPMKGEPFQDAIKEEREILLPFMQSYKIDGIRGTTYERILRSNSMKPLPNGYLNALASHPALANLDFEIVVGSPCEGEVYNRTSGPVRTKAGEFDFHFYVFDDLTDLNAPATEREARLRDRSGGFPAYAHVVEQNVVHTLAKVYEGQAAALDLGYEGTMLKRLNGVYRPTRTSTVSQEMLKFKEVDDFEVRLLGVVEGTINTNEAFINELGRTTRSTHQAGLVPSGMVGTLRGERLSDGAPVNVAPGKLTHDQRRLMLANPDKYVGHIMNCRSMAYGVLESTGQPRHARFNRWRDSFDV